MRRWSVLLALLALTLFSVVANAQSNQVVDRLLDASVAPFGDAAYMILNAAGIVPEQATGADVVAAVDSGSLLPGKHTEAQPITLGEVCALIMRTQKMKGGLLYMVFPGPRYAAREFAYLHLIKGLTHPGRTVSGEEVIRMLEGALELKGGQS